MPSSDDPFDRAFDSVLVAERADLSVPPARPLPADVERQLQQALQYFAEGHYLRARDGLGGALPFADADPRVEALAAACGSLLSGRVRPGMETCMGLLERSAHVPELYAILGVLLLRSRHRAEAHAAFRNGLRLAPLHRPLRTGLDSMGIRRAPPLRFLHRAHLLNRWLGQLRSWLDSDSLASSWT